jgi:molybdenum cofactor biosynthesis enzyme MoaA
VDKLRLLITKKCDRNCTGCCNNDWDLDNLPLAKLYGKNVEYSEILITGGEPLLQPKLIKEFCDHLKTGRFKTPVYIYTACTDVDILYDVLKHCDGLTVTLHTQEDGIEFFGSDYHSFPKEKSLRLNVFEGITVPEEAGRTAWKIKDNICWIKNCPLPKNEVFRKHILF